jgi:hypothetical protein
MQIIHERERNHISQNEYQIKTHTFPPDPHPSQKGSHIKNEPLHQIRTIYRPKPQTQPLPLAYRVSISPLPSDITEMELRVYLQTHIGPVKEVRITVGVGIVNFVRPDARKCVEYRESAHHTPLFPLFALASLPKSASCVLPIILRSRADFTTVKDKILDGCVPVSFPPQERTNKH